MGNVTDENGNAVPFASVKIKNTKTGAAADAKGSFIINANAGATLVVSATGYATKEIVAGGDNTITVMLSSTSSELTNVVVTTALGIQRQAKDLGYATTTINNKTLIQGRSVNMQQALKW